MQGDNYFGLSTMAGGDLYGSSAIGGGSSPSDVAPAAVQASAGGIPSSGIGPAWSFVGFLGLLVILRVVIELGGEVE